MRKLICLNGPMGCGKTKLVEYLSSFLSLKPRYCKDHLHELTIKFFCVEPDTYWKIYEDRELKELPNRLFKVSESAYHALCTRLKITPRLEPDSRNGEFYLSIRHAMIYVSECLCKPTFGLDYFGIARIKSMSDNEIAIDDSTGFAEELPPAVNELGQDNVILIRIHGRGEYDSSDSRNYIPSGVIDNEHDVYNDKTEEEFHLIVRGILENWLYEKDYTPT